MLEIVRGGRIQFIIKILVTYLSQSSLTCTEKNHKKKIMLTYV